MEAWLNSKIDAISKIVEKRKTKNHRLQWSNSNMSLSSSSSSEPPSNRKAKGNQYRPYIVYPPKAKIELLKYSWSEDQCVSWLNKAKEYVDIYNSQSNEEKVKYASMHMEGYAYNWYLWWRRDNFTYTWNLFKKKKFNKFQGTKEDEFLVNLPDYNRLEALRNSHISGNLYRHEYLGFLTSKDLRPI